MRRRHALITLTLAACAGSRPRTDARASLQSLRWMQGNWRGSAGGGAWSERWSAPSGATIEGSSSDGRGEAERLRIESRDDGVYYVASPRGQATTAFRLASQSENSAVFENLAHDFPQRIIYRRTSPRALLARIEGPDGNGGTRAVDFLMELSE